MTEPPRVSDARREELAKLVREQVVAVLQDDLDGGESVMKEVWEACEDAAEDTAAEDALRAIIAQLKRGA
jgi:hypothetical protein